MAGVATETSGAGRSLHGGSSGQHQLQCQSGEESTEWRSLEQVENGTPSTSPPYWDTDEEEDGGLKPSELYGKYTWKIDKFSKINKRELRSNAFEVGGCKWYILIYPQGCDVCNHLSLFLCVANHDKLLPGWSHLAQFTIAVVNKDPKKSKYSDTLHRFWKKEHDWGWKKFMELPKVIEGFIDADADTLIIKAQVQVIRERTDRPFRCLDCLYRRELVRVYLSNVETICRKYLEQQRAHLGKLIEDKARWSSFCGFWLGMDKSARRHMSQENTESILKLVLKQFFVGKEVTSTLVMDSLYIGMKALEGQYKGKKSKGKYPGVESPVPIIHRENDTFVLVDDVMLLLERAAMEPLPVKDEKGPQNPQNRTKDGTAGEEFSKDSIDRDEMRLTELGRRTIEIFVLQHIFSNKIEIAYQEAVALKRQEELIEEEAAWLAEIEQRAGRGTPDKDKKSKKKQGKQKKNNRRGKNKVRNEKLGNIIERDNIEQDSPERDCSLAAETEILHEKTEAVEDVSDASGSIDCEPEIVSLCSEGRDASRVNWDDTDSSELHPTIETCSSEISGVSNGAEEIKLSSMDDSSSTCSSDSVAPVVVNVAQRGSFHSDQKNQKTPSRGRNYHREMTSKTSDWVREERSQSSEVVSDEGHSSVSSRNSKTVESPSQVFSRNLQDGVVNRAERFVPKKEEGSASMHRITASRDVNVAVPGDRKAILTSVAPVKLEPKLNTGVNPVILKNPSSIGIKQVDRANSFNNAAIAPSKPELQKINMPKQADRPNSATNAAQSKPEALKLPIKSEKPTENPSGHQLPVKIEKPPTCIVPLATTVEKPSLPVLSRPLSAPLVAPVTRPAVSVVSVGSAAAPTMARSASATGRLAPEPPTPSYLPQSYRNAIVGSHVITTTSPAHPQIPQINCSASTSGTNMSLPYSPVLLPLRSTNLIDSNLIRSNFSYGMVNHHQQQNMLQSERSFHNDMQRFESYRRVENYNPTPGPAEMSGRQGQSLLGDESYRSVENYHPAPVLAGISGRQGQSLLGDESYMRVGNCNPTPGPAGMSGHQGQSLLGDESYRKAENYNPTPVPAGISGHQGQSLLGDESYRRVANYNATPGPPGMSGRQGQSLLIDESYRRDENYHPTPSPAGISGRQGQSLLGDEFPHLDIINDLLDDDNVFENSAALNSGYQNFSSGPDINRQFGFPGESVVEVPSTSSCGFERSHMYQYHDNGYRSSRSPYDTLIGDMAPRSRPQLYMNGQIDDLISNQWQMTGPELQYLGVVRNNAINDGNLYHHNHHMIDSLNLGVGVDGYTMFRPSNGEI